MLKPLKDWPVGELKNMMDEKVHELYADMLATAHDIGYKVPDHELIETEKAEDLRRVIPPLHEGLVAWHAANKNKKSVDKAPSKKGATSSSSHNLKASELKLKAPKKAAESASQKGSKKSESTMSTATAKKTTAAKPAKKVAKAAKKGKANANARTAVGTSRYADEQTIKITAKENPAREGTGAFDRIKNLFSYNGKTVGAWRKSKLAQETGSTLATAVRQGWATVK
jgi:hypothetical protein